MKRVGGRRIERAFILAATMGAGLWHCNFAGGTTASWVNPVNGLWTDPSKWSTGAYPNNDSPSGTLYDVNIGAADGSYTVTLNGTVAVQSLELNSPTAILFQNASSLSVANGIDVEAGTYQLEGGTLINSAVTGSGGTVVFQKGTVDGITLGREALINNNIEAASITVRDGLSLNGGTLHVTYNDALSRGTSVLFNGNQSISGTGTLLFDGNRVSFFSVQNGTLTIGSDVKIRGAAELGYALGGVINNGEIDAEPSPQPFVFDGFANQTGKFVNQGLLEAKPGAFLDIEGVFDNSAGTILANGGSVNLGGNFLGAAIMTTAQLGALESVNGGSILLGGILNNGGATLTANASTGTIGFTTINGGTLATSDGSQFAAYGNASLTSTTVAGRITMVPNPLSDSMLIAHNVTLSGGTIALQGLQKLNGAEAILTCDGAGIIGGSGSILFQGNPFTDYVEGSTGTLTIGSQITVATDTTGGLIDGPVINQGTISAQTPNYVIMSSGTFTNQGTILVANGGTVSLQDNWSNAGTMIVTNSNLQLGGTFTTATIGKIIGSGGSVSLIGTLNNNGSTLTLDSTTGNYSLFGGTISGGTVVTHDGAALQVALGGKLQGENGSSSWGTSGGTISGVTLAGEIDVPDGGKLNVNGLTFSDGSIQLNGGLSNSQLTVAANQTIGGTGTIFFNGTSSKNLIFENLGSMSLGANVSVVTGIQGGSIGSLSSNLGLISAQTAGKSLTISGGSFTNQGTLQAINGATLAIQSTSWTNSGTILLDSSELDLGGSFTTGGIGTIIRNGGLIKLTGTMNNLSQTFTLGTNTGSWTISGGAILSGNINSTNGVGLVISGGGTLSGVNLMADVSIGSTDQLTFAGAWNNAGTVHLNGGSLNLGGTFTTGSIGSIVRSGGTVSLTGTLNNSGNTLLLDDTSGSWFLRGGSIIGGTLTTSGSASLLVGVGTFDNVTLATDLTITNGGINLKNGLHLSRHQITLNSSVSFGEASLTFNGTQSLDGTGTIIFGGTGTPLFNTVAPASGVLTIGNGIVIKTNQADGTIGASGLSTVNQGTISAQGNTITLSGNFTNQGTIEALNGGAVVSRSASPSFGNSATISVGTNSVFRVNGVTNNTGTIDVSGTYIVDYSGSSPISTVRNQIVSGFNAGQWDGTGINSATAAGNSKFALGYAEASTLNVSSFSGQSVDKTALLVRLTLAGDADLDGAVGITDFNMLAGHFGGATQLWTDGDFNYDGVVNLLDLNAIAMNFGQTLSLSSPPAEAGSPVGVVVPEPGVVIGLVGMILVGGRRKRCPCGATASRW